MTTEHQRFIAHRVITENLPVTYKLVSRHFDIHVNVAKMELYAFYELNQQNCDVTYVITGTKDNAKQIKLTSNLSSRDHFDSVSSVQIFSIKSKQSSLSIDNLINAVNEDIAQYKLSTEKCDKWGLIKGPELVLQSVSNAKEPLPTGKKHDLKKKEDEKVVKKAATPANSAKKDPFAISSLYTSRKKQDQAKTEPAKPLLTKPKYQYTSRKAAAQQPVLKALPAPVKKMDSALNALFDDDDDDTFEDDLFEKEKEETPIEVESKPDSEETGEQLPQESVQSVEKISDDDHEDAIVVDSSVVETKEEPEIDEDGYIITKKKPETGKKKQKLPLLSKGGISKKPLAKGQPKKQSSLMSFFGKR